MYVIANLYLLSAAMLIFTGSKSSKPVAAAGPKPVAEVESAQPPLSDQQAMEAEIQAAREHELNLGFPIVPEGERPDGVSEYSGAEIVRESLNRISFRLHSMDDINGRMHDILTENFLNIGGVLEEVYSIEQSGGGWVKRWCFPLRMLFLKFWMINKRNFSRRCWKIKVLVNCKAIFSVQNCLISSSHHIKIDDFVHEYSAQIVLV